MILLTPLHNYIICSDSSECFVFQDKCLTIPMPQAPGIAGPLQFLPPPREPPNQEGQPAPVGPLFLLQQVSKPAVDILWSHSRSAWLWLIIGPNVVVIECCKDAAYWKSVIRNELAVVWWRHVAKFIYCNSLLKECDQKGDMIFWANQCWH